MTCKFIEDINTTEDIFFCEDYNDYAIESMDNVKSNIKFFFTKIINWFRRIISTVIEKFKKLLGIKNRKSDITITDKEKIIPIMRVLNNSHQLNSLSKEFSNLLNLIPGIMNRKGDPNEINEDIELYINHANEYYNKFIEVKSVPDKFSFNVKYADKQINEFIRLFKNLYQKVSTQSPNVIDQNGKYSKLYIKINSYLINKIGKLNSVLLTAINTLTSESSKTSTQNSSSNLLNGKVTQTIEGFKVIEVESKRFPYTKATNQKELVSKYGNIFIVIDNNLFRLLSSKTRQFTLLHEVNHCKQIKSGENENLSRLEEEVSSDLYAAKKMGLDYKGVKKIFDDLINCAIKVGQKRSFIAPQFETRLNRLKKEME